jgi:sugar transferase (PEP-CTERM/EpsH1 system associated)
MRVLFLTHRLPYAPNRGDRIRAYHTLQMLRGRADVHLVSLVHDDAEAAQGSALDGLVTACDLVRVPWLRTRAEALARLPGPQPLTHVLLNAPSLDGVLERAVAKHQPDVVLAYCSGMARCALNPPLSRLPLVIDMVDVDSRKWQDLGAATAGPRGWIYRREAGRLARFEAEAANHAFATTLINSRETDALRALAPGARVETVPSGVDVASFAPVQAPAGSLDVVFCGVMNYAPNEEAAIWLAKEVWPLVHVEGARLRLVGSQPTPRVTALSSDPTIDVTGDVPDVRPYLWGAAVSAAPLRVARGLQNKVLEAVSAGLPVVVTPVVAEGLPDEVMPACTVAGDPQRFAAALTTYLRLTPAERRSAARRADLSGLSWPHRLAPLYALLGAAVSSGTTRRHSSSRTA